MIDRHTAAGPKFETPRSLLMMMEAWGHTSSTFFHTAYPFFAGDIMIVMKEYDCKEEAAVAILFSLYADEMLNRW